MQLNFLVLINSNWTDTITKTALGRVIQITVKVWLGAYSETEHDTSF
jgi:hypothetical protein